MADGDGTDESTADLGASGDEEFTPPVSAVPAKIPLRVFNAALQACEREGFLASCFAIWNYMGSLGVSPDVTAFQILIAACGRAGLWERALGCMVGLEQRGLMPTRTTYLTLITALEKNGRWLEALDALDDMTEMTILPDVIAYSTAISACLSIRYCSRSASCSICR